jgi:hypothetical protein
VSPPLLVGARSAQRLPKDALCYYRTGVETRGDVLQAEVMGAAMQYALRAILRFRSVWISLEKLFSGKMTERRFVGAYSNSFKCSLCCNNLTRVLVARVVFKNK